MRTVSYDLATQDKPQAVLPSLEDIQYRRKIAAALQGQAVDASPVQHWTQAAARAVQGIVGAMNDSASRKDDATLREDANAALMAALGGQANGAPSLSGGMSPAGMQQQEPALTPEQTGVAKVAQGFATPNFRAAVAARQPMPAPANMANAPASIRHNNPGAMWPGPSSQKFGATGSAVIGGGNKIATFPDAQSGAAAQFDLLNRKYAGKPLAGAIAQWSGGNSSPAYVSALVKATGLSPNTVLTPELLANPQVAVPLARAMAQWEAGQPFPLDDNGWQAAHRMGLGGPQTAQAASQGRPQQPIQVADASGNDGIRRLLANPYTRDLAEKLIMQRMKGNNGTDKPSNVQEYEYFKGLDPEQQQRYLEVKRSQKFLDLGPEYRNAQTGETISKNLQAAEEQKASGKNIADIKAALPKLEFGFKQFDGKSQRLLNTIDRAIGRIGPATTGWGGLLASLPESEARALENDLNTIRANVGFTELQNMRDASPTGGALGQVSEMENRLLQSTTAAIDQLMSGGDLKENLGIIRQSVADLRAMKAYSLEIDRQRAGQAGPKTPQGSDTSKRDAIKQKWGLE